MLRTGRGAVPPCARAPAGYLIGAALILGWIALAGGLLQALTAALFVLGCLLGWSSLRGRRHR
jgi:hypothetical protein